MTRYQSSGLDTTYDRTVSNYDWDGEYVPSKQNWSLSRTPSDHLWPLAGVLPVITFGIYNLQYHCPVQQTGALGTKFIKMEEKHLFWKYQLIPCNWGKNLSPFFTVYNFNSITAPEYPLHQLLLKMWTCLLHTLNSQRGFVMKHAWSLTMYIQQFWNLLLLLAC